MHRSAVDSGSFRSYPVTLTHLLTVAYLLTGRISRARKERVGEVMLEIANTLVLREPGK